MEEIKDWYRNFQYTDKFNKEKNIRSADVIERLKDVRKDLPEADR